MENDYWPSDWRNFALQDMTDASKNINKQFKVSGKLFCYLEMSFNHFSHIKKKTFAPHPIKLSMPWLNLWLGRVGAAIPIYKLFCCYFGFSKTSLLDINNKYWRKKIFLMLLNCVISCVVYRIGNITMLKLFVGGIDQREWSNCVLFPSLAVF